MSENAKKSMEINSLLEETEDLAIGAGTVSAVGNLISIAQPVSSAMPLVSIKYSCLTVVTRGGSRCPVKPILY